MNYGLYGVQTQDWINFMEFWKLYNYNIGKKFVRVAKNRENLPKIRNEKNIELEYFRKKSHSSITKKDFNVPVFKVLSKRDTVVKYFLAEKASIEKNPNLEKFDHLPIISKGMNIIEELSKSNRKKTSFKRYSFYKECLFN